MNIRKSVRPLLPAIAALFLLFLVAALPAAAQFNASLSGTVQDPTQAVVPGATVSLTNTSTQQTRTTTSNGSGFYSFTELAPGSYNITATAKGFKTANVSNIAIAAETPRSTDITLSTGGTTETVNVDADAVPTLQTSDASIGSTISSDQIQRLPAFGGDPYELLRTAPGITGDAARSGAGTAVYLPNGAGPGQSNRGIFQTENQVQISASGQGVSANNYTIDGVSVNSLGQAGAAVVTPNQESVSAITTLSSNYSALYGRNTGAQIQTVTKSGTNQVHGSAYFRYDEPGLNAYNRNANASTLDFAGPPIRVNNKERDWAASLGFPILHDKLFFFGSYEGFTFFNKSFVNQWVETPQFDSAIIANRPSTVSTSILNSPGIAPRITAVLTPTCSYYTTQKLPCQVVGTGIDVGSFGPASNNGTYYRQSGTANFQTGSGLDGVPDLQFAQLLIPSRSRGNQWNGRIDFTPSQHDQFAFSAFVTKADSNGTSGAAGSRPGADVPQKPLNDAGTFIFIHTFSPSTLNEFRANATRFFDNQITDAGNSVNYGIPFINIQNLPVPGNIQYGVSQSSATPGIFAENTYEIRDTVIRSFGTHVLHIGAEYRWEQDNNNLGGGSRPVYAFQGLFNFANNAPIYEGISADPTTGGPANTARYLRSEDIAGFVQHDWTVTPNFTLNTGIRYEYFAPIRSKGNQLNLPVLGPAGSELSGASLVPHNHFYQSDYTGWSPKVGFAWTPAKFDSKVVVRGGFARAMNRLNFSLFDNAVEDGPGFFNFGLCCGTNASDFGTPYSKGQIAYEVGSSNSPFSFAPNPALKTKIVNNLPVDATGAPITIEVYGAPARVKIPYAYLYSMEIQTLLRAGFTFTIGYQGSEDHHLPRLVNQNFLFSTTKSPFSSAYFAQDDSNSNYNALNLQLNKNFHRGYQLSAIYTYSKSLDQVSNGYGANSLANQTNPADNRTEWGPSDFDVRHRVTVSGLWDIPGTKGDQHIVNALTNGWQVNAIYTWHTGFPFTPVVTNLSSNPYVPTAATISPARPYAYFGGFQSSCSNSNYINGTDVKNTRFITSVPTGSTYRPGIGRNSFIGPCYTDTDVSLAREQKFNLRDHAMTLRFQANLYNALNTLNLLPYVNGNADPSAQIVGGDPTTDPTVASSRSTSAFGRPTGADAGREIEFFARLFF